MYQGKSAMAGLTKEKRCSYLSPRAQVSERLHELSLQAGEASSSGHGWNISPLFWHLPRAQSELYY